MAEKLCTLRTKGGGGGRYKETSLWTNSAPTSNFASQTVTLSDNISNYKYLKLRYRSSTTVDQVGILIIDSADFITHASSPNYYNFPAMVAGGNSYARAFSYSDVNKIAFGNAARINYAQSSNTYAIPLEILGLNELDHGKNFDETTLWTNSAPTNTFASQTVSLSASMAGYDYIKLNYRISTSDATAKSILIKPTEFTSDNAGRFAYGGTSSTNYARLLIKTSDTQITISDCKQFGGTTTTNTLFIPTSIVGCKFR